MARYLFTHPDKRTAEVSAHNVSAAWPLAADALKVLTSTDVVRLTFVTLVDPKLPTDLEALARRCTSNGAFSLMNTVRRTDRLSPDGLDVFTGSGKYTTLAAMGVFAGLRKLGLACERVDQDCSWNWDAYRVRGRPDHSRPNERWMITPLGRQVGELIAKRWREDGLLLSKELEDE